MPGSTYESALRRLFALGQGVMLPGRGRLRRLLERAGHPELSVPSVLVGGTNGKGRLVTALSAVLSRRYRTGAFIKPHLVSVRERWRLDDRDISEEQFATAAEAALDLVEAHGEPISFFEANVLLGALLFSAAGCEIAVWEVGLGGAHDACNLVDPLVSVLTGVGFDHQMILGHTLPRIAADKARIARPGRPLILAPPRPGWQSDYDEYRPVVEATCAAIGAHFEPLPALPLAAWSGDPAGLPPDTRALLDAVLAHLAQAGFAIGASELEEGLQAVRYRARMEHTALEGRPALLDAAHNPDALRWLAHSLKQPHPFIFGCQMSRDPRELLYELRSVASVLVPIEVPVLHPCPAARIAQAARASGIAVSLPAGFELGALPQDYPVGHTTELDPPDNRTGWIECVRHGLSLATPERPVVVCGSIYCIGEVLRAFEGPDAGAQR